MSEEEMLEGYRDGLDPLSPTPSGNRSKSYLHGFANGRDDLANTPRDSAETLRQEAEAALKADEANRIIP